MSRLPTYLLLSILFTSCKTLVISRCDLAEGLYQRGVAKNELNDWVCLAEAESGRNTQAVNRNNPNGSWDYGIFQINSMYWCKGEKTKTNYCSLDCNALLSNSLDPSAKCAMLIRARQGFTAWYGWRAKCKGKDISFYTRGCSI